MLYLLFLGRYLLRTQGLVTLKAFDIFQEHVLEEVTVYSVKFTDDIELY